MVTHSTGIGRATDDITVLVTLRIVGDACVCVTKIERMRWKCEQMNHKNRGAVAIASYVQTVFLCLCS